MNGPNWIIIILAIAITLSNVFSKVFPSFPIFMIQIITGIILGFTEVGSSIHFEPEVFLVMIICSFAFREGDSRYSIDFKTFWIDLVISLWRSDFYAIWFGLRSA